MQYNEEQIANLESRLVDMQPVVHGVTHHDTCWKNSPEHKAMQDRMTQLLHMFLMQDIYQRIWDI